MAGDPHALRLDRLEASLAATVAAIDALRAYGEEEARRRAEEARRHDEEARRHAEELRLTALRRAEEDKTRAAEYDRHQREWNRERGEIARKLGTLVEDIVSPSVPRVVTEVFGVPEDQIERHGIRQKVRRSGRGREFDVVTLFPGHALIVESKTQLRPEDVAAFLLALGEVRDWLPEVGNRKIIGAVASLYLDDAVVKHAERQGLVVMGLGDHLMEPKNTPGFRPREF